MGEPPAGAEDVEAEARTHLENDPDPCDYLFDVAVGFANAVVPYRYDMGGTSTRNSTGFRMADHATSKVQGPRVPSSRGSSAADHAAAAQAG